MMQRFHTGLQKQDLKTHFFHVHPLTESKKYGALTVAFVSTEAETAYGVAKCSKQDQFDRRKGRLIAQGRAYKQLCLGTKLACPPATLDEMKIQVARIMKELE